MCEGVGAMKSASRFSLRVGGVFHSTRHTDTQDIHSPPSPTHNEFKLSCANFAKYHTKHALHLHFLQSLQNFLRCICFSCVACHTNKIHTRYCVTSHITQLHIVYMQYIARAYTGTQGEYPKIKTQIGRFSAPVYTSSITYRLPLFGRIRSVLRKEKRQHRF